MKLLTTTYRFQIVRRIDYSSSDKKNLPKNLLNLKTRQFYAPQIFVSSWHLHFQKSRHFQKKDTKITQFSEIKNQDKIYSLLR